MTGQRPRSYYDLTAPSFAPSGSLYAIVGVCYMFTVLLEGGAGMAALLTSDYKLLDDKLATFLIVNYKVLCFLWPVALFYTQDLIAVFTQS